MLWAGTGVSLTITDNIKRFRHLSEIYKEENNAIVLTDVDKNKFMSMFLKRIFKGYDDIIHSIEGAI